MKKLTTLVFSLFLLAFSSFASIDTISIYSNAMHRNIKAIVVKPNDYAQGNEYPTVYLLHGAYGNYENWAKKVPAIETYANKYKMLIVCPDGAANSWYFDSPIDSSYKFETHISTEVPEYIDAHYKTKKDRKYRAIAGLSMGGHGAFFIAYRHSETFGACGSMSGALVISVIDRGYDLGKRIGDFNANNEYYKKWSVVSLMENPPKDSLAMIIDCGVDDFIFGMSKAAHDKLTSLKIKHDYIERPGKHDWPYWANAVQYQLLFFNNFFEKKDK